MLTTVGRPSKAAQERNAALLPNLLRFLLDNPTIKAREKVRGNVVLTQIRLPFVTTCLLPIKCLHIN